MRPSLLFFGLLRMQKKMLDFSKRARYNDKANRDGRLAQLVAHPLDVREVTSSSLVSSTNESASKDADFLFSVEMSNFLA